MGFVCACVYMYVDVISAGMIRLVRIRELGLCVWCLVLYFPWVMGGGAYCLLLIGVYYALEMY